MNDPLHPTLVDAIALLRREQLPYALIGGLAVSLRGQPRATADVDVVVLASIPDMLDLLARLDSTSFKPLFAGAEVVVERSCILPLRHRSTDIKVDVAIGLSGFEQQVVQRAELLQIAGSEVAVATAEDLLLMKVLAGRTKDDDDVAGLIVAQGPRMDWEYILKTAADLGEAIGHDLTSRVNTLRDGINVE